MPNAKDFKREKEREKQWKQVGGQKLDEYAVGAEGFAVRAVKHTAISASLAHKHTLPSDNGRKGSVAALKKRGLLGRWVCRSEREGFFFLQFRQKAAVLMVLKGAYVAGPQPLDKKRV